MKLNSVKKDEDLHVRDEVHLLNVRLYSLVSWRDADFVNADIINASGAVASIVFKGRIILMPPYTALGHSCQDGAQSTDLVLTIDVQGSGLQV